MKEEIKKRIAEMQVVREDDPHAPFLPIKAMREIFRELYPHGSVEISCPELAPEKDGVSYMVKVVIYEDNNASKLPIYSRYVKVNPAQEEATDEYEDPFNLLCRIAEYKAMEAVGATVPFNREMYLASIAAKEEKKAPGHAPTEAEKAVAASFPVEPKPEPQRAKPEAKQEAVIPKKQPETKSTATDVKKPPEEKPTADTKKQREEKKPVEPDAQETPVEQVPGHDLDWARSVISVYRNTSGQTMGEVFDANPRVVIWFASSARAAEKPEFAEMIEAAKIIVAASEKK